MSGADGRGEGPPSLKGTCVSLIVTIPPPHTPASSPITAPSSHTGEPGQRLPGAKLALLLQGSPLSCEKPER